MMNLNNKQSNNVGVTALIVLSTVVYFLLTAPSMVIAQYSGSQYRIEEAQIGSTGGDNDLTSDNFRARATIGDTAVGIVNSTTYQAIGGFTTSDTPELEVIAGSLDLDLGDTTVASTLTGTSQFGVRSYLSEGYVVIIRGVPPTQESGYTMNSLTAQTGSSVGIEQFGINLAANTDPPAPDNFGSNPEQVPDGSFSFGYVNSNYDDNGLFRYNDGDIIAQSNSSSGVTNYTISYIVNISTITRAGTYIFAHSVNVVATY